MSPLVVPEGEVGRLTAWRCIGCGKVEAPQPCIGVCSDRKVELVEARDYDMALARIARVEAERDRLLEFLRMMARNKPHEDCWESSYRHLQALAESMLDSNAGSVPAEQG